MTTANTLSLYQKTILALNKAPLNYGMLQEKECCTAECHNPQCGDHVKLFAVFSAKDKKKIEKITFNGESCALTRASASLMTKYIKGKELSEISILLDSFSALVNDDAYNSPSKKNSLGELGIFNSVNSFPSRKTCALLPWKALEKLTKELE